MENQHRHITGYRDLSQAEIDLMNEIKRMGTDLDALCERVRERIARQYQATQPEYKSADDLGLVGEGREDQAAVISEPKDTPEQAKAKSAERDRLNEATPGRWQAIAKTHLQEGLMALTRAVAQPSSF